MKDISQRPVKMDPVDRQSLEESAEALKDQIRAIDGRETETAGTLDRGLLVRQLAKKEAILNRDQDLEAKGVAKDKLAREAREIEAEIKEHMPTHNEMWAKSGTVEMERAVRKNMAFEAKFGDKVRRWKEIQNRLEPDDPLVSNVERIRPGT